MKWLTEPRAFAALVTDAGPRRLESELYHFGDQDRVFEAELYLLKPGHYRWTLTVGDTPPHVQPVIVSGRRTRMSLRVPSRILCRLVIEAVPANDAGS